MRKLILFFSLAFCSSVKLWAQETFHVNGLSDKKSIPYLITGATIHIDPQNVLENGSIIIKDGKIADVGLNLEVPDGLIRIDASGKHVYAGLIDAFSDYGMPEIKPAKGVNWYNNVFESSKKGAFNNNEAIKSETKAASIFTVDKKNAEEMRALGFSSAWVHVPDGISRGTGAVVTFGDGLENENLIKTEVGRFFAFNRGSSTMSYPISIMGMVALLRQTYLDADWYAKGGVSLERNLSLEAFNQAKPLQAVFDASNINDVLRADFVGDEFGEQYLFKGTGDEYQKLELVKKTGGKFIIPIDFPEAEKIDDALEGNEIGLNKLRHWNLAANNPKLLHEAGVEFAISAQNPKSFYTNLRKALDRGLTEEVALAALTTVPAKYMGLEDKVGKIEKGFLANLLITDKPIFEKEASRLSIWIQGKEYKLNEPELILSEAYTLKISGELQEYALKVKRENGKNKFTLFKSDSLKQKAEIKLDKESLSIKITADSSKSIALQGFKWADGSFHGTGIYSSGQSCTWLATPSISVSDSTQNEKDSVTVSEKLIASVTYPFSAYGNAELPKQKNYLIKNATIWTNESDGILKETDVLVKDGKVSAIGKNIKSTENTIEIDGTGKHLTSGIIDEHSHIALFSVNELQTVSAQVRQRDALNPDDVNIYRQLAGGVTTSQLLHGSADCIGGQSAIIKLKWGETAEGLLIKDAPRFIKFALGENVKRGNATNGSNRYPLTRMGVEQVFMDAFAQAKDYQKEWEAYSKLKDKKGVTPPRRDLKLEALVDILNKDLHITCHSYVQSEINMLMHVADSMGFDINTFTHILEGYKVADKMKERGIYGSTFADWWAYKMEVREAIPYNNAIMNKVGVKTAINSDDAEMARRLNQEAAKTMLYGDLTEEEAWKTVTLYPAMMLRLEHRIGSIKKGKDADLVLWNDHPLSVYAKPEKTMIEGKIYFDQEDYVLKTEQIQTEKNRLIQAMMNDKGPKGESAKAMQSSDHIHCDSVLEFGGISLDELASKSIK